MVKSGVYQRRSDRGKKGYDIRPKREGSGRKEFKKEQK